MGRRLGFFPGSRWGPDSDDGDHFSSELLPLRRRHKEEDDVMGTSHDAPKGTPKTTNVHHLVIRMRPLEDQLVSGYLEIPATGHRNIPGTNATWKKESTVKAEQESRTRSNGTETRNRFNHMSGWSASIASNYLGYLLIPHFMTMYIRYGTNVFERVPQYKQPGMTVHQCHRDNNALYGILQSVFNLWIGIQMFHTPVQVQGYFDGIKMYIKIVNHWGPTVMNRRLVKGITPVLRYYLTSYGELALTLTLTLSCASLVFRVSVFCSVFCSPDFDTGGWGCQKFSRCNVLIG
jgi:hypothetical protein